MLLLALSPGGGKDAKCVAGANLLSVNLAIAPPQLVL
jgi:hypothetical protein